MRMGMDIPINPNRKNGEEKLRLIFLSDFFVLAGNSSMLVVKG
jgi:hypothetical protein